MDHEDIRVHLFALYLCVIVCLCLATLAMFMPKAEGSSAPQVREYEDHSARITYADYVCIVPAYDSPGDRISCHRGAS